MREMRISKEERFAGKQNSAEEMGNRIAKHISHLNGMLEKSTYYLLDAQGNQISMYEHLVNSSSVDYTLVERNIYGSSLLGVNKLGVNLFTGEPTTTQNLGLKYYHISNHLGNVLTVFSDLKTPITNNGQTVSGYEVTSIQTNDYSPFGVELDGRSSVGSYRYGYQGSEVDDELKGDGNSYTTHFRQLDPRLGRWMTIDPKATAFESPFVSMGNNPISNNDVLGDTVKFQGSSSEKLYNGVKNFANDKINNVNKKISEIEKRISNLESKNKPNTSKIDSEKEKVKKLNSEKEAFNGVLNELECLEKSEHVYRIRYGEENFHEETAPKIDAGGSFSYNISMKELDINVKKSTFDPITGSSLGWSAIQKLAHELKHADQFQNNTISLRGKYGGSAYDITDEYEAFTRQNMFAVTYSERVIDVQKMVNLLYTNLKPNATSVSGYVPNEQSNFNGKSCGN